MGGNMFDIVYYKVPRQCMYSYNNIDIEDWAEIIVTDSEHVYEYSRFMDRFCQTLLADDFAKVAQVLWTIKEKNEQVVFRKKHNGEYSDETIIRSENDILEKLKTTNDRKSQYMFEYIEDGVVSKLVCSHYYENISIYVRKEQLQGMEKLLEKIAEKGDYYKYELDEG